MVEHTDRAQIARAAIYKNFPSGYEAGACAGFLNLPYPHGFHSWPLERRDAAGFNLGRCDRVRYRRGDMK